MLYEKMRYLLENQNEQLRLGKAAYQTIVDMWNATVAAERLYKVFEQILAGEKKVELYEDGPCSRETRDKKWITLFR